MYINTKKKIFIFIKLYDLKSDHNIYGKIFYSVYGLGRVFYYCVHGD